MTAWQLCTLKILRIWVTLMAEAWSKMLMVKKCVITIISDTFIGSWNCPSIIFGILFSLKFLERFEIVSNNQNNYNFRKIGYKLFKEQHSLWEGTDSKPQYLMNFFFFLWKWTLHIKHKINSHLAPWLLWVPGIQKK